MIPALIAGGGALVGGISQAVSNRRAGRGPSRFDLLSPEQRAAQENLLGGLGGYMNQLGGDVQNPYGQLSPYESGFQQNVEKGAYRDLAQNQRQLTQSLGPHKYAAALGRSNLQAGLAGQLARMRQSQYQSERGMEFAGAQGALGAETSRLGIASSLYGQALSPSYGFQGQPQGGGFGAQMGGTAFGLGLGKLLS